MNGEGDGKMKDVLVVFIIFIILAMSACEKESDDNDNDDGSGSQKYENGIYRLAGGAPGHNGTGIAVDSKGKVYVAAVKGRELIVYSMDNDQVFEQSIAFNASSPDMAIDEKGVIHIVYFNYEDSCVDYAKVNSGKVEIQNLIENTLGETYPQVVLDDKGDIHLAINVNMDKEPKPDQLIYGKIVQGKWELEIADQRDSGRISPLISLAVDSGGNPAIAYINSPHDYLFLARKIDGEWVIEDYFKNQHEIFSVSIDFDSNQQLYAILKERVGDDYYYDSLDDPAWSSFNTPDTSIYDMVLGSYNSGQWELTPVLEDIASSCRLKMKIDSQDRAHVWRRCSYWDEYENPDSYFSQGLYFDILDNNEWDFQTLKIPDNSGVVHDDFTLDGNSNRFISAFDPVSKRLRFHSDISGDWETENLDDSGDKGDQCQIEYLDSNNAIISYLDLVNDTLEVSTHQWNSDDWEFSTVFEEPVNKYYGFAVDPDNGIHLFYSKNDVLLHNFQKNGDWESEVVFDKWKIYEMQAASDANGNLHIVFHDSDLDGITYMNNVSGQWTSSVLGETDYDRFAMAVTAEGKAHFIFYDRKEEKVFYAGPDNSGWKLKEMETTKPDGRIAIAVDSDGLAHIAYQDRYDISGQMSMNLALFYGTNSSGSWQFEFVKDLGHQGFTDPPKIKLDESGNPAIIFMDVTSERHYTTVLKLAVKKGNDWEFKPLDEPGIVGRSPSFSWINDKSIGACYYGEYALYLNRFDI